MILCEICARARAARKKQRATIVTLTRVRPCPDSDARRL